MKHILSYCAALFTGLCAYGQTHLGGTITGPSNDPLEGVHIVVGDD